MNAMACEEYSTLLGWMKESRAHGGCFSISIFPLGFFHGCLVFNWYFTEFDLTRLEPRLFYPKEKRSVCFFILQFFFAFFWFYFQFKKDGFKVDFIEAYDKFDRDMLDLTPWLK